MIFIDRSIAAAVRLHYELPGRVRGPRGPDKGANQLVERSLTRATSVGSSWPIRSACHPVSLSHSPPLSSQTCCNFYRWACLPLLDITGHQSPARTTAGSLELCHGLSAWDTLKKKREIKFIFTRVLENHTHTLLSVCETLEGKDKIEGREQSVSNGGAPSSWRLHLPPQAPPDGLA